MSDVFAQWKFHCVNGGMFWLEHSKALEWTDEILMMQILVFVFYQHVDFTCSCWSVIFFQFSQRFFFILSFSPFSWLGTATAWPITAGPQKTEYYKFRKLTINDSRHFPNLFQCPRTNGPQTTSWSISVIFHIQTWLIQAVVEEIGEVSIAVLIS